MDSRLHGTYVNGERVQAQRLLGDGDVVQIGTRSFRLEPRVFDSAQVFQSSDPLEALNQFIAVFVGFWESDRAVLRGLNALAALDPEFAAVLEERSGWRRKGVRVLVERLARQRGRSKAKQMDDAADLPYTITSFSTYDTLAGPRRTPEQVTKVLQGLARYVIT